MITYRDTPPSRNAAAPAVAAWAGEHGITYDIVSAVRHDGPTAIITLYTDASHSTRAAVLYLRAKRNGHAAIVGASIPG